MVNQEQPLVQDQRTAELQNKRDPIQDVSVTIESAYGPHLHDSAAYLAIQDQLHVHTYMDLYGLHMKGARVGKILITILALVHT